MPALAVAGVVLLIAAGLVRACGTGADASAAPDVGTVPEELVTTGARATAAPLRPGPVVLEPPGASPTTPSGRHLEPWPVVPGSPVAPVAMTLPGHPAASVVPAGVTAGELDLPLAASELAWWKAGAGLDSGAGTVVLAGHVDTAADGLGYLAALATVDLGAVIDLRGEDGVTRHYRVTGRRSYDKEQGLPGSVFDQRVQPRLAVITCAGRFEPATRSYQSNLVVYAVPAGSRPGG